MELRLFDAAAGTASPRCESTAPARRLGSTSAIADRGRMHFWRPLPPAVMDLICGEGTAREVTLHAHEALQVLLPMSRFSVLDGAGHSTVVAPGVIHLTSPLELQAARGIGPAPLTMRIMLIAPAALTDIGGASLVRAARLTLDFTQRVVDDSDLYGDLSALFDQLRRPLVALDCKVRLLGCLTRLLASCPGLRTDGRESDARHVTGAERTRDYLRSHVADGVTLDRLASVAGISKFYLLRVFRRAFGLTPHAYQMQLRLARARRLIAEGRSLTYVAYDAGFADQSHLTRRFTAFFGLTPARFARQLTAAMLPAAHVRLASSRAATQPPAA